MEILAASEGPLSYEVLRHVLRLTEEDMIETLAEAVRSGLVRRLQVQPASYELPPGVAQTVRGSMGEERLKRLGHRVAAARERVHGPE